VEPFLRRALASSTRDLTGARAYYDAAIHKFPDNADLYFYRSFVEEKLQDRITDLSNALRLHEQSYLYRHRGIAFLSASECDKAIEDFTNLIRLSADDTDAYLRRSEAYERCRRSEAALKDVDEALKVKPLTEAYVRKAELHRKQGDLQKAFADIREGISRDASRSELYEEQGDLFLVSHEKDDAKAIKSVPATARALGRSAHLQGRWNATWITSEQLRIKQKMQSATNLDARQGSGRLVRENLLLK
jgi:tetratricopeptide (TPR) repeat protein